MELRDQIKEFIIKNYNNTSENKNFLKDVYKICTDYYKRESKPGLSKQEKADLYQEIFDAYDMAVYDLSEHDEMKFRKLSVILSEYSIENYLKDRLSYEKLGKNKNSKDEKNI